MIVDMIHRLLFLTAIASLCFAADPWTSGDIIPTAKLAQRLEAGEKPLILYVGFPVLYRGAHIPGAVLAGPASTASGMEALKEAVANVPKNRELVLYCGCCPWTQCPNVRPAFAALKEMGFKNVKLVEIPTNLHTDWISKGYPIERAAGTSK